MSRVSLSFISSFATIFNLFEVEMGKHYLVLIREAPFLTGEKGVFSWVKTSSGKHTAAWLETIAT